MFQSHPREKEDTLAVLGYLNLYIYIYLHTYIHRSCIFNKSYFRHLLLKSRSHPSCFLHPWYQHHLEVKEKSSHVSLPVAPPDPPGTLRDAGDAAVEGVPETMPEAEAVWRHPMSRAVLRHLFQIVFRCRGFLLGTLWIPANLFKGGQLRTTTKK